MWVVAIAGFIRELGVGMTEYSRSLAVQRRNQAAIECDEAGCRDDSGSWEHVISKNYFSNNCTCIHIHVVADARCANPNWKVYDESSGRAW